MATSTEIQDMISSLTELGRATMLAVGQRKLSFFDEGITAGSGIWGECLTGELGHKSSGVINRLAKLGLFTVINYGKAEGGAWFELTELGAAVALRLATQEAGSALAELADRVAPAASAEADLPLAEIMAPAAELTAEQEADQDVAFETIERSNSLLLEAAHAEALELLDHHWSAVVYMLVTGSVGASHGVERRVEDGSLKELVADVRRAAEDRLCPMCGGKGHESGKAGVAQG